MIEVAMANSHQQLQDLASEDLGYNHEQKIVAQRMLDEQMGDAKEEELAKVLSLFREGDKARLWLIRGLCLLMLIMVLPMIGKHSLKIISGVSAIGDVWGTTLGGFLSDYGDDWKQGFSDQEKLLLFGDEKQFNLALASKALWQSEPENPAYYTDYLRSYHIEYEKYPSDMLQVAQKIDPENGWFLFLSATVQSGEVIEEIYEQATGQEIAAKQDETEDDNRVPTYRVLDEKSYGKALAQFYQAVAKPRMENYHLDLMKQRIALLPVAEDYGAQFPPLLYLVSVSYTSGSDTIHLVNLIAAEAQRCGREKDVEGLKKLMAAWERASGILNENSLSLIDGTISFIWMSTGTSALQEAAEACGLDVKAQRYRESEKSLKTIVEKISKPKSAESRALIQSKAGILDGAYLFEGWGQPVSLSANDLDPGRMAEYALINRALAALSFFVFLLLALFSFFYRFRHGPVVRRLSAKLSHRLFQLSDYVLIVGLGVVLPMAYYWIVTSHSAFTAQQWGADLHGVSRVMGQWTSLSLLLVLLTRFVAQWRMSVRGRVFGFELSLVSGVFAVPVLMALPLYGGGQAGHEWWKFGHGLNTMAVLYLGFVFFRALLAQSRGCLACHVSSRIMVIALILSAVGTASMIPSFYAKEQRWVSHIWLTSYSVNEPSCSRYEYLASESMKQGLRAVLNQFDEVQAAGQSESKTIQQ